MLKKNLWIVFFSGYLFGCFLFSPTDFSSTNIINRYEIEVRSLKNEVGLLNLSDPNTYESSIYEVEEVSSKKYDRAPVAPIDIKTKTTSGKNSIFVNGFQAIRAFPARPRLNYYDSIADRLVKPSLMVKAHLECIKEINNLPRKITKEDKNNHKNI